MRGARRNRIDRHRGGIDWLTTRTRRSDACDAAVALARSVSFNDVNVDLGRAGTIGLVYLYRTRVGSYVNGGQFTSTAANSNSFGLFGLFGLFGSPHARVHTLPRVASHVR